MVLAKLLLAVSVALLTLAALEVACRVLVHQRNQGSMEVAFSKKRHLEDGERVALIDIIQASTSDDIVYELKPNLEAVPFKGVPLTTNRFGFRGEEIEVEEGPNTVTIVGIGDSVMFGHGEGDGKNYLAILQNMLRAKYPQKDWRVINTGVPAYNTVMEVATLRRKALAFGPDLVILGVVQNDLVLPQYVCTVEDVTALDHSFLMDLLFGRAQDDGERGFDMRAGRDSRLASGKTLSQGEIPERYLHLVGWEPFYGALDELKQMSEEHGFPVVTYTDVESDITDEMLQATAERGFFHVAVLPEIQAHMAERHNAQFSRDDTSAYQASSLVVGPTNAHPSHLLHFMGARKLLAELERAGYIDRLLE